MALILNTEGHSFFAECATEELSLEWVGPLVQNSFSLKKKTNYICGLDGQHSSLRECKLSIYQK